MCSRAIASAKRVSLEAKCSYVRRDSRYTGLTVVAARGSTPPGESISMLDVAVYRGDRDQAAAAAAITAVPTAVAKKRHLERT
jgi:hypothetical protein